MVFLRLYMHGEHAMAHGDALMVERALYTDVNCLFVFHDLGFPECSPNEKSCAAPLLVT